MPTLFDILSDPTANWSKRRPASETAIQTLAAACDFTLPEEYVSFLRFSNGGEGFLCIEPWYFQLCTAETVADYNRGYEVKKYLPGYFAVGSDGGGEMLAIRKRDGTPCPIYTIPFIGMCESDAVQIAHDFEMFALALGRNLNKPNQPLLQKSEPIP